MQRIRTRGWKMVIHQVYNNEKTKDMAVAWLKTRKLTWSANSIEPYPEDESRHHLHIFVQYAQPQEKHTLLSELQKLAKKVGTPRPEGEERDWNRVDVKTMKVKELKKDFDGVMDYLQGATKDKPTGEIFTIVARPCHRRVRINRETKKYEEFCSKCVSAECSGCCTGCEICTPCNDPHDEIIRRRIINNVSHQNKMWLRENRKKVITPSTDPYEYPKIEYI